MLQARQDGNFISEAVRSLLCELGDEGLMNEEEFLNTSHSFYETAVSYFRAWEKHIDDIHDLHCLLQKRIVHRDEIRRAALLQTQKCSNTSIDMDYLFDKTAYLLLFLTEDVIEKFKTKVMSLVERWHLIFQHLKKSEIMMPNLQRFGAVIFALPGSNASVKRIFRTWTVFGPKKQVCFVLIR